MVGIVGFSLAPILGVPGGIGNNGIRRGHSFFAIRNCNLRSSSSSYTEFSYTTVEAAACEAKSNLLVEYLIESHRFSREDAILIASKVINQKSRSDPTLVLDYLKQIGMEAADIKKTVSKFPKILFCDLDKNIRPKIQCLEEIGLFGPDIVKLIVTEPRILRRGLDSHLRPILRFLVQAVGRKGNAVKFIKRDARLLSNGSLKNITENLPVLRDMGLLDEKDAADNKSVRVYSVISVAAKMPKSKLDKIIEILRSFGWHDLEIYTLLQKETNYINHSENRFTKILSFLTNELGYGSHYLATRPQLLVSNLEKTTIPRSEVLKILEENQLTQCSLYSAVMLPESKFYQDFVLPYKDEFPDMYERYMMHQRSIPMRKLEMDKKIEIMRSFGWSDSEIYTMLQKQATGIIISEDKLKKALRFFMKEHGYESHHLVTRPHLLMYCLEKRTIPRSEVMKILNENQLTRFSLSSALAMSESNFFQKFVLPYKDKFPDMYERYIMHQRSIASPPSSTT